MRSLSRFAFSLALLLCPGLAWADVLRVSRGGAVEYIDLQSAVDAAAEGDVIVVGEGTYPGFSIVGKGIAVVAMPSHVVIIEGPVQIAAVPTTSTVLLSDLRLWGTYDYPEWQTPAPALEITDCTGGVFVQGCWIEYKRYVTPCHTYLGVTAASVTRSTSTSFVDSRLLGHTGSHGYWYACNGYAGGDGLRVVQGSKVALYGSEMIGARGGDGAMYAGDGGHGAVVHDSFLSASGCTFRGGRGGSAKDFVSIYVGVGGDGLRADASSEVAYLDSSFQGGNGGFGVSYNGAPGAPIAGDAIFHALPGQKRSSNAPSMVIGGESMAWTVQGQPGDSVLLASSQLSAFQFWMPHRGTWRIPFPPARPPAPVAHLASTSALSVDVAVPLPANGAGLRTFQALHLDDSSQAVLGPPWTVVALDPSPPHSGVDCNANGELDLVNLLRGTSLDLNLNLLPDECSPVNPTGDWYVDAAASPGGDGSPAAPFEHLSQAFYWGDHGDTVHLLPGIYTGTVNRELDFRGRALNVRGVGGADVCILDAEDQGRFFVSTEQIPGALRIEGLTMRRGRPTGQGNPWGWGGAMLVDQGPQRLIIDECRFESCTSWGGEGGAIAIRGPGRLEVTASHFIDGGSWGGGAIYGSSLTHVWIQGTTFLQNILDGNNVRGSVLDLHDVAGLLLQDCVIAGNEALSALSSAAIRIRNTSCASASDVRILGCTVVGNPGAVNGSFLLLNGRISVQLRNTIVWSHPNGGARSIVMIASSGCGPELTVYASNIEAGPAAVHMLSGALVWGPWNISSDPLFEDPFGPDGNPDTWLDNDLSLSLLSPCIDAGHNGSVPPDIFDLDGNGDTTQPAPFDILGNPRIVDIPSVPDTGFGGPPTVDMGAFERQP